MGEHCASFGVVDIRVADERKTTLSKEWRRANPELQLRSVAWSGGVSSSSGDSSPVFRILPLTDRLTNH